MGAQEIVEMKRRVRSGSHVDELLIVVRNGLPDS
jgi:hypothetical protein